MISVLQLFLGLFLALMVNVANADWVRITPYGVNLWPSGGFGLWTSSGSFASGCGTQNKQFLIIPGSRGVTVDGQKSFQAVIFTAIALGKPVDVNFYPADNCKVDSVTLVND